MAAAPRQPGPSVLERQVSSSSRTFPQVESALAGACFVLAGIIFFGARAANAQGVLTVTPGRTVATAAGTGTIGYTGDNGGAVPATLALPSAVAYDGSGNLYIADANNHVVREIAKGSGAITTIAGTGVAGFSGDGGAATSAQLDTPTGIAIDANGNLYIADSHNQRIREVSAGKITTIAGTGVAGYSGDGSAATSAQLDLPGAVAVDANGNVYIADTNNQRVRKVSGGNITTVAGTGEQNYTGDGGAATSASLDSPAGVAVDSAGNLYISDRHNHRIREVSVSGMITTLAGSGTPTFAGGFGGDGAAATAASLASPTGISVDTNGDVYIADSKNQRVRQISNGSINTVAGTGEQGFAGDSGPAVSAVLDTPRAAATDASGNLAIADTFNQRIRSAELPTISFGNQAVGLATMGQPVTLANTGNVPITVSTIAFAGDFTVITGGSCSASPITLAAGASCTENITYLPTKTGAASGSVTFGGTGVVSQAILLTGSGTQSSTTITITSNVSKAFVNQAITLTATVQSAGFGKPTGTVTFYDGSTVIGTPQTLANGAGSLTTAFAAAGTYNITAVYSGDTSYTKSTSSVLSEPVVDFNLALNGGSSNQTVEPGQSVAYSFTVASVNSPFTFPVTLSATGLPPSATVTFTPSTFTQGGASTNFTMTVHTAPITAMIARTNAVTLGMISFALLLLPFTRGTRRPKMSPLCILLVGFGGLVAMSAMSGCGAGFFAQPQRSYTINVIGTATGSNGATLQHSTPVTLTVQ